MTGTNRSWSVRVALRGIAGVAFAALAMTCQGHHDAGDLTSDKCRLHPEDCNGGVGGLCHHDDDCASPLFCCTDNDNCGDGMCTTDCRDDHDCPGGMLCEHGLCFYMCDNDDDCASTMSCEHGETICEYP